METDQADNRDNNGVENRVVQDDAYTDHPVELTTKLLINYIVFTYALRFNVLIILIILFFNLF